MMEGSPSPPKPGIVGGKEGIENKPPSNGLDQVRRAKKHRVTVWIALVLMPEHALRGCG